MFISRKNHILTNALLETAAINFGEIAVNAFVRLRYRSNMTMSPDMLNNRINNLQNTATVVRIILTALVFIWAFHKLNAARALVSKDDYSEMAKLQEELNPKGVSTLSSYSVSQLLQIWTFILVGVNILQEMGAFMYQRFIAMLTTSVFIINLENYLTIYNVTHGFKYIGMLTADIIAVFVTGIFLRDNKLKVASLLVMFAFVGAFALMEMNTITLAGRNIGIVWTSVIYHLMQTAGLLSVALYLRDK